MELGSLFKDEPWSSTRISAEFVSNLITSIRCNEITTRSAKRMLAMSFEGDKRSTFDMIDEEDLRLKPLSADEYVALARTVLDEKPDMVRDIKEKGQVKKAMYFVGQMVNRSPDGSVEPKRAEQVVKEVLGLGGE
jgi:aspartyl-tRNA(Asn)/glutamyl-tRNA(Gln) amidotransferase subunit B